MTLRYVASASSDKYHKPSCEYAERIYDGYKIYYDSKEAEEADGRTPCALFVSVLLLPIVKKSFFLLFKICYFWFYAWTLIVGAIQLLIPTAKEHSIYYGAAIYYGTILFASFFNYLTNEAVGRDIVYFIGGVITSLLCAVHHYKNKDI